MDVYQARVDVGHAPSAGIGPPNPLHVSPQLMQYPCKNLRESRSSFSSPPHFSPARVPPFPIADKRGSPGGNVGKRHRIQSLLLAVEWFGDMANLSASNVHSFARGRTSALMVTSLRCGEPRSVAAARCLGDRLRHQHLVSAQHSSGDGFHMPYIPVPTGKSRPYWLTACRGFCKYQLAARMPKCSHCIA